MNNSKKRENECKIFKLSNSETIIGTVTEETITYFDVMNPLKLAVVSYPDGRVSLSFFRWDYALDEDYAVRLLKGSVVAIAQPNELMIKNYNDLLSGNVDDADNPFIDETVEEELLKSSTSNTNSTLH